MFQEIPVHQDNIFAYRVTGRLTHADYQAFLPRIEELIARCGRISLFLELEGFRGWDLQAAQDDFRFGVKHRDAFERIALVGDTGWERWMALMARPFMNGEIRFFPSTARRMPGTGCAKARRRQWPRRPSPTPTGTSSWRPISPRTPSAPPTGPWSWPDATRPD